MESTCPKCQRTQAPAEICIYCGLVFSKYRRAQEACSAEHSAPASSLPAEPEQHSLLAGSCRAATLRLSSKITIFSFLMSLGLSIVYIKAASKIEEVSPRNIISEDETTEVIRLPDQTVIQKRSNPNEAAEVKAQLVDLAQQIKDLNWETYQLSNDYRQRWYNSAEPGMDAVKVHIVDDETRAAVKKIVETDRKISSQLRRVQMAAYKHQLDPHLKAVIRLNSANQEMIKLIAKPEDRWYGFNDAVSRADADFSTARYELEQIEQAE